MAVAIPLIAVALSAVVSAQQTRQQQRALRADQRDPAQAGTSSTAPVARDPLQPGGIKPPVRKKGTLLGDTGGDEAAVPGTAANVAAPVAQPFSARKTLLGG